MADRNREFANFVVDVGPHMHSLLPHVAEYVLCSTEAKLLNKPTHEVALVLYGSTETKNDIAGEIAAHGGDDQYQHISVRHPYKLVSHQDLRLFKELPPGQGYSDILDALTVAADMMVKTDNERALMGKSARRVVLISNFKSAGKGWDESFLTELINTFKNHHIKLEVLHLDFYPAGGAASKAARVDWTTSSAASTQLPLAQATPVTQEELTAQSDNLDHLTGMLQELGGDEPLRVRSSADLAMAVKWADVSPTTLFSGSLSIGTKTHIPVKVYKKVAKETLPSLKPYVPSVSRPQQQVDDDDEDGAEGGGTGGGGSGAAVMSPTSTSKLTRARDYHVTGDPDDIVQETDIVRAHRYGRQAIPVSDALESSQMKYVVADKGFWLWGFMPASEVKRFCLMSESIVVIPSGDSGSAEAVSALVRVMHEEDKVAVARFVARGNSRPRLVLLSPWLGTMRRPDAWIGNYLPFEQDVKWVDFPPLGRGQPVKEEQLALAEQLVDSMQLAGDSVGRELLAPETTPNPVIRRFYLAVANRSLDGDTAQVPDAESDHLVQAVCEPPAALLAAAEEVRKRFSEAFPLQVTVKDEQPTQEEAQRTRLAFDQEPADAAGGQAGAGAGEGTEEADKAAVSISTATPLDDFNHLLSSPGKVKAAVTALCEVVIQLVDESVSSRNYDKAASCVAAVRRACVEHVLPADFNEHLQALVSRFKSHEAHAAFVSRLVAAGVTLIADAELNTPGAAGAVSVQESERFLQQHAPADGQTGAAPAAQQEQDEFADMD